MCQARALEGKQTHLGHQHEPGEHLPGWGCLGVLAASACTMGELLAPHQGPCFLEEGGRYVYSVVPKDISG